jgi:hypothetical protein
MHNQFPKRTKAATNNSSNVQTRTPASGSEGLNRTVKRGFTVLCSMRHVIPVGLQRHLEFTTVTVHVLLNQDVRGSFITGKFLSAYPKRRVQSSVPIFVGGGDERDTHEVTKAQLFRWTCGVFRFHLPKTVNAANSTSNNIAQSTSTLSSPCPLEKWDLVTTRLIQKIPEIAHRELRLRTVLQAKAASVSPVQDLDDVSTSNRPLTVTRSTQRS